MSRPGMSDHLPNVDGSNIFVTLKYFYLWQSSSNINTVESQLDINIGVQVQASDGDKWDT